MSIAMAIFFKKWDHMKAYHNLNGSVFPHCTVYTCKDENNHLYFYDMHLLPLQDMIHIADTKVARRYGDFFIRQIHKFEEVI